MAIFDVLKELDFPKGKYLVVGGGVMEALGLRQTDDLDVVAKKKLFDTCLQSGHWIVTQAPNGNKKLKKYLNQNSITKIELYLDVNAQDFKPTTSELLKRSVHIKGFPFISLLDLMQFKKAYGRPKDRADLALLENLPSQ